MDYFSPIFCCLLFNDFIIIFQMSESNVIIIYSLFFRFFFFTIRYELCIIYRCPIIWFITVCSPHFLWKSEWKATKKISSNMREIIIIIIGRTEKNYLQVTWQRKHIERGTNTNHFALVLVLEVFNTHCHDWSPIFRKLTIRPKQNSCTSHRYLQSTNLRK